MKNKLKKICSVILVLQIFFGSFNLFAIISAAAGEPILYGITSISVVSYPHKTHYFVGETVDTDGLVLLANCDDGEQRTVDGGYYLEDDTVRNKGQNTITVVYHGARAYFTVIAEEENTKPVTYIKLLSEPYKTKYYVGDTIDTTGLVLLVKYDDGEQRAVYDGYTLSDSTIRKEGYNRVVVGYGGKYTFFTVSAAVETVKIEKIEICTEPAKRYYDYVADNPDRAALDFTGLTLKTYYSNGTEKIIEDGFSCVKEDPTGIGKQKIIVTYEKFTTYYYVYIYPTQNFVKDFAYQGRTYVLFSGEVDWCTAKKMCEDLGGHLATITSQTEQKAIEDGFYNFVTGSKVYWLGGTDEENEGEWKWVTGEDFSSFNNWRQGDPDNLNGVENYLTIWMQSADVKGQWVDAINPRGFICEFENANVPYYSIISNNHLYSVYHAEINWEQAKQRCENLGGHLVTITSAAEQKTVERLLQHSDYKYLFIGCTDKENEGSWQWVNGENFNYSNWKAGEPNNGDKIEHYGHLYSLRNGEATFGKWNDIPATTVCGFILEMELDNIEPTKAEYFGDRYYEAYNNFMSMEDAQKYAESKGGHLVAIGSEEENEFVSSLVSRSGNNACWLGGKYDYYDQEFNWNNGEKVEFTAWAAENPKNNNIFNEHVVLYADTEHESNKWYSASTDCSSLNNVGFIIEYENHKETVTFRTGGYFNSTIINQHEVEGGKLLDQPREPVRYGYRFTGWYTDPECSQKRDFDSDLVRERTDLYAGWEPEKHKLNLNSNGGLCDVSSLDIFFGQPYGQLPVPQKDGYLFKGWTDKHGNAVDENTVLLSPKDYNVFANWEAQKYHVYFNIDGYDSKQVTFGEPYGELPIVSVEGKTFKGWSLFKYSVVYKYKRYRYYNSLLGAIYYSYTSSWADSNGYSGFWEYRETSSPLPKIDSYEGWDCYAGTWFSNGPGKTNPKVVTEEEPVSSDTIVSIPANHTLVALFADREVESAEIINDPQKVCYHPGETVDLTGLSVNLSYDNGETQTVDNGFSADPKEIEEDTSVISVSYGSTFIGNIPIDVAVMTGIKISLNEGISYVVGDTPDISDIAVTATFNDGFSCVLDGGYSISPAKFTRAGKQRITVTYNGFTAYTTVTVSDATLEKISIASLPLKQIYYVGESLECDGLELLVTYVNGVTQTVSSGYDVDYSFESAGNKTVTVTYRKGGLIAQTTFDVTVCEISTVYAQTVFAQAGKTVQIPVSIRNNQGLMGFSFVLKYDKDILTPISTSKSNALNGTLSDSIGISKPGTLLVTWNGTENTTEDQDLFTVSFAVNANAVSQQSTIEMSYVPIDTFDENWNSIPLICSDIPVFIIGGSNTPSFVPEDCTVSPGEQIELPITVSSLSSYNSFSLDYDHTILTPLSVRSDNSQLNVFLSDNAEGTVTVSLYGGSQITNKAKIFVAFQAKVSFVGETTVAVHNEDGSIKEAVISVKDIIYNCPALYTDVSTAYGKSSFVLPVMIKNNTGLMGFAFNVKYDSQYLTLTDVQKSYVISNGNFDFNVFPDTGNVKIVWSGSENVNSDGTLFFLNFQVAQLEAKTDAIILIDYESGSVYDESWQNLSLKAENILIELIPLYKINYVADGETVYTVDYFEEAESFTEPLVPPKAGYIAHWQPYSLTNSDQTVYAIYALPSVIVAEKRIMSVNDCYSINYYPNYEAVSEEWLSSNRNVAVVDDFGNITAVGSGTCEITFISYGEDSCGCAFSVQSTVQIIVNENEHESSRDKFESAFVNALYKLIAIIKKFFGLIFLIPAN